MVWIISIIMLVFGCFKGSDTLIIGSALYAIAGAISFASMQTRKIRTIKDDNN